MSPTASLSSTTSLAITVAVSADQNGPSPLTEEFIQLFNNVVSVKRSSIDKKVKSYKDIFPFNVDYMKNVVNERNTLKDAITSLEQEINKNKARISTHSKIHSGLLNRNLEKYDSKIAECQIEINKINAEIPSNRKIELKDSKLLPDNLNITVTNPITQQPIHLNEWISIIRQKASNYEVLKEIKKLETQLKISTLTAETHHDLVKKFDEIKRLQRSKNEKERMLGTSSDALVISSSPKKLKIALEKLSFFTEKQEKYRINQEIVSCYSKKIDEIATQANLNDLNEIRALIRENRSVDEQTDYVRQPIVYGLVKNDRKDVIDALNLQPGMEDIISSEFKQDILQHLKILILIDINMVKNELMEMVDIMERACNYEPPLIKEGLYNALAEELATAYNKTREKPGTVYSRAENIINEKQDALDSNKIHQLLDYFQTEAVSKAVLQ